MLVTSLGISQWFFDTISYFILGKSLILGFSPCSYRSLDALHAWANIGGYGTRENQSISCSFKKKSSLSTI